MPPALDNVTAVCFAASYSMALALELLHQFRPRPVVRLLALVFTGAGLLAHTLFIASNRLPLETPHGSLVIVAWVLAVFSLYGSLHYRKTAWGLFVLPVVLGLVVLAALVAPPDTRTQGWTWALFSLEGKHFWPVLHGVLLALAAVGVSVGFVASVMYLVQVYRLRAKLLPGRGVRLLSLERLEEMNRRAINLAFPLLTTGLLVGAALLLQSGEPISGYLRIVSLVGLWVVFAILLFLRYRVHARGRQTALLTILAFALLVFSLVTVHPFAGGVP
ncbi:MAG: cytochrome c biogenesis protein CcsA [Gemmataceae bacterium]|nr:cytochrome c biogenesis protein CcsA [Gemmataceae bacterium]